MKVYGLYTGNRFEGGSIINIYSTVEKAMSSALRLLKSERKRSLRILGKDAWEEIINRKDDSIIKIWQDDSDAIIIYEYKVK